LGINGALDAPAGPTRCCKHPADERIVLNTVYAGSEHQWGRPGATACELFDATERRRPPPSGRRGKDATKIAPAVWSVPLKLFETQGEGGGCREGGEGSGRGVES
jgi:hypothetical protein